LPVLHSDSPASQTEKAFSDPEKREKVDGPDKMGIKVIVSLESAGLRRTQMKAEQTVHVASGSAAVLKNRDIFRDTLKGHRLVGEPGAGRADHMPSALNLDAYGFKFLMHLIPQAHRRQDQCEIQAARIGIRPQHHRNDRSQAGFLLADIFSAKDQVAFCTVIFELGIRGRAARSERDENFRKEYDMRIVVAAPQGKPIGLPVRLSGFQ